MIVRMTAYPSPAWQAPTLSQSPVQDGREAQRTNQLALWALIVAPGLLGLLCSAVGILLGFVALRQIKERGEDGREMAIAAIVVGAVASLIHLWATIVFIGFILKL